MWKQVTWMPGTGFGSWNLYRNFDLIRARKEVNFVPICIDHMRLLNSTSFDSCFVRNHFTFDSFDFANNSRTIIWLFSTHLQLRHSVDSARRKNFQKSKRELIFLFMNFCYYFVCHYDDWCLISFSESVKWKILVAHNQRIFDFSATRSQKMQQQIESTWNQIKASKKCFFASL